jgi:hypothetical protein
MGAYWDSFRKEWDYRDLTADEARERELRDKALRDRQVAKGPVERLDVADPAQIRAAVDAAVVERSRPASTTPAKEPPPPAPKQEPLPEAKRMELTPQEIVPQPAPSPGGGIVYRNTRAVQRTAADDLLAEARQHQLVTGKDVLQKLQTPDSGKDPREID